MVVIALAVYVDQTESSSLFEWLLGSAPEYIFKTFDGFVVKFDLGVPPSSVEHALGFISAFGLVAGQTEGGTVGEV